MLLKTESLRNRSKSLLILTTTLFIYSGNLFETTYANTDSEPSANNTQINKGDRSDHEVTAGQQSNSKDDIQITRRIRQDVVKDKSLSSNAHNVKIITENGKVTLKGPVRSEQEKEVIEHKAQLVAGVENVQDQLEVVKKY